MVDLESVAADTAPPKAVGTKLAARRVRLLAAVFGIAGAILAIAVPLLPVTLEQTTLDWPTAQGTKAVSAPLTAQAPISLDAKVPCATARSLVDRTGSTANLFNTNPPNSSLGTVTGMALQVGNGQLTLSSQGQQLGAAPLPAGDCLITVHTDAQRTTASVGGTRMVDVTDDHRPQVTGIYSDLTNQDATSGLSVSAQVDNRWASSATGIKLVAIVLSVLCFLAAVLALYRMDRMTGRRAPRLAVRGWWRLKFLDVAVLGTLVVWWLIGAMTADDGYFTTMARVRGDAGYIGEYYRWFAAPDAPMAWFVDIYAWMTKISTLTPWMRLPSLLMGVACWMLISRGVLPRLGRQVRISSAAGWAAGAVFLAFWLPYDNGLRPENLVALLSLITICCVERAVATRRLGPAAIGLTVAALCVAVNPHGLMAVLPFVVGLKPLAKIVLRHARRFGWVPVIAPIAAAGLVILALIFCDQTLRGALESVRLRSSLGPTGAWYDELDRYSMLFSDGPDGSMTRRFPVLLVFLCLATCVVVLLRRGNIRGAALGPSRRLLGISALSFVVLALAPTKHTHHFGMLVAIGGPLAALTALSTSTTVLLSRRNRAAFFAGLMVIVALAATGPNAWWYVSSWGVPWFDLPPQIFGIHLSTVALVGAAIALVIAGIEHMRHNEHEPFVPPAPVSKSDLENRGRALRLGLAPLSTVCAILVLFEIGSIAKGIQKRWDTYNMGADNVRQLAGKSCGLSDYIKVERDPKAGMLEAAQQPLNAAPGWQPPADSGRRVSPSDWLASTQHGFVTNGGLPSDLDGKWKPPYEFGKNQAPIWGSYHSSGDGAGDLRTQWYSIPDRARDGSVPVVVAIAGKADDPNSLTAEFGKDTPAGFQVLDRAPLGQQQKKSTTDWRDARVSVPEGADRVRIVAKGRGLGSDGWVAFSAPRAPKIARMTEVVGTDPAFLEWSAAAQHPCLRPSSIHNGIAEVPKYRISAGDDLRQVGRFWSAPAGGGPFVWMDVATKMEALPTYLEGDVDRDWGTLYAVTPDVPDALPASAAMHQRVVTHSGLWSPGPLAKPANPTGE
ncbi:arabinosyltransferase domain-containing protein [Amycolatopsis benzoatilytica]|uniref:arabinosyltransferase domain-containing protein n=1 Tax=Amycolatopsis benzoatilytica TaxID=346045 RepID=UPI00037FDAC4|nr:arabinosyltransferase domain-containing protein [Amycolatopsis benzoatilytica]